MTDHAAPTVIALGGNAISPPHQEGNITQQFVQTRLTSAGLADIILSGEPVIITHGNGPQVGNAIRRVELSAHEVYPLDLGICVADLQGGIGYMISQCLMNELRTRGSDIVVSTIVTNVVVDVDDPAFTNPSKPVGSFFEEDKARQYAHEYGWDMVHVARHGWRRVVPSPRPKAIVEIGLIRRLLAQREVLVAVGGGGIPVAIDEHGMLQGHEAVIDKDLATGLLGNELNARMFVMITDVEKVSINFEQPTQRNLDHMTVDEARRWLDDGQFPPGSMGPKIEAAIAFLEGTNATEPRVVITSIEHITDSLRGAAGTTITRG